MKTLEDQLLEAIEKHNNDLEDGLGTTHCDTIDAAKECAIIARDYAKRFAEYGTKSGYIFHPSTDYEDYWFDTETLQTKLSTEELMQAFDESNK